MLGAFGSRGLAIADTVAKWTMEDVYDGSRFQETFGWRPTVPLRVGIQSEVAWYRTAAQDLTAGLVAGG